MPCALLMTGYSCCMPSVHGACTGMQRVRFPIYAAFGLQYSHHTHKRHVFEGSRLLVVVQPYHGLTEVLLVKIGAKRQLSTFRLLAGGRKCYPQKA